MKKTRLQMINGLIKTVMTSAAKLNETIHEAAVLCIEHAAECGDATPALRLVKALPKSHRRGLLINWFGQYSPIGLNITTDKCGLHKPEAKAYKPFDVDGAKANPFYDSPEAHKEDLPSTFEDVTKKVGGLAASLQKRLDNGLVAANDKEAVSNVIAGLFSLAKTMRPVNAKRGIAKKKAA